MTKALLLLSDAHLPPSPSQQNPAQNGTSHSLVCFMCEVSFGGLWWGPVRGSGAGQVIQAVDKQHDAKKCTTCNIVLIEVKEGSSAMMWNISDSYLLTQYMKTIPGWRRDLELHERSSWIVWIRCGVCLITESSTVPFKQKLINFCVISGSTWATEILR